MNQGNKTFEGVLQSSPVCDIISAKKTWLICPGCRRQKLARLLPGTQVRNLPLYCRSCRREVVVNILSEPEP